MMMLAILAITCAGFFAGAAVYITLVEHPARIECGTALALAEFAPSYRRAATMQGSLAIVGGLTGLGAWLLGAGSAFLVGGVLMGAIVPFTLVVIFPVNRRLLDPTLVPSAEADHFLMRWARLHAGRSLAGSLAFVVELLSLVARG